MSPGPREVYAKTRVAWAPSARDPTRKQERARPSSRHTPAPPDGVTSEPLDQHRRFAGVEQWRRPAEAAALEHCRDQAHVLVVRHPAAVVHLGDDVPGEGGRSNREPKTGMGCQMQHRERQTRDTQAHASFQQVRRNTLMRSLRPKVLGVSAVSATFERPSFSSRQQQ